MNTIFFHILLSILLTISCTENKKSDNDISNSAILGRIIYNNDSDDLKWPAFGHDELWVPFGSTVNLESILPFQTISEYLDLRLSGLKNTPVGTISYCGNFGIPVWEWSKVGTTSENISIMGDDPLLPIINYTHNNGMKFLFSLRMNDFHHTVWKWPHLWDQFRLDNSPDLCLNVSRKEWQEVVVPGIEESNKKTKLQLSDEDRMPIPSNERWRFLYNYAFEKIRKHYLDILIEACKRYDLDGIELDWLRHDVYFLPGEEEKNIALMTSFVQEIKKILEENSEQRNKKLLLTMRLPDSPAEARKLGLDAVSWVEQGLVDVIIAGHGTPPKPELVKEWVTLGSKFNVPIYGCITRSHSLKNATHEELKTVAKNLWNVGVSGLYLFNYYLPEEYYLLDEFGNPEKL
jgi:hypothetical protein